MLPRAKNKARPPDAPAVVKRAIILKHLLVKGLATPPPDYLAELMKGWSKDELSKFIAETQRRSADQVQRLRDSGLWNDMDRPERDLMQAVPPEITKQSLMDANWLAEAIVCLLWALGYVSELLPYDEPASPELTNLLPAESAAVLVKKAALRPADSIRKQRDLAELWHWRARTRQLQESGRMPPVLPGGLTIENVLQMSSARAAENGAFPSAICDDFPLFRKSYRDLTDEEFSAATSIAMERHRALNWLCGYAPKN